MSRDRRLLGSIVLLLSLVLGSLGPSPASARPQAAAVEPGRITGTVTGPGGVPLEAAFVSAYQVDCVDGCASYAASTGVDGAYELNDVQPGTYYLLLQKGFGYIAEYYDNVLEQRSATDVVVAAGSTVAGVNAQLEHGGHLTGVVTGRGNRPLKGITVTVYRNEGGTWQYVGETSTAGDGSYDATGNNGLLSGVYRLRFTDDSEPGYVAEFYSGAGTLKAATNVVMGENETVAGLDAHLSWPRKLRSVKAPKVTGKPKAGATLRLFPGTWSPAKVTVEVLGWYADDLYHYLGSHTRKLKLVGQALAQARGKLLKVRFTVARPGYITVTKLLTVRGGKVTG